MFPFLSEKKGKQLHPINESFFDPINKSPNEVSARPLDGSRKGAIGRLSDSAAGSKKRESVSSSEVSMNKEICKARLISLRNHLVGSENSRPALIFTDSEIAKMVEKCPTTIPEFMDLLSVDDEKYEKYGRQFLSILKEEAPNIKTKSAHFPKKTGTTSASKPKAKGVKVIKFQGSIPSMPM